MLGNKLLTIKDLSKQRASPFPIKTSMHAKPKCMQIFVCKLDF